MDCCMNTAMSISIWKDISIDLALDYNWKELEVEQVCAWVQSEQVSEVCDWRSPVSLVKRPVVTQDAADVILMAAVKAVRPTWTRLKVTGRMSEWGVAGCERIWEGGKSGATKVT